MLPLLLALLAHPAGESRKIGCLEGARHREVQVGGVELVLDLLAHRVPYRTLHRRLRVLVHVPFSPFVCVPEHGLYPFLQTLVRKEARRVLVLVYMRGSHINQEDSEKTCPELLRNVENRQCRKLPFRGHYTHEKAEAPCFTQLPGGHTMKCWEV